MEQTPELRDGTAGLEGTSRSLFRVDCKLTYLEEKGLSKRCYHEATGWTPENLCAALHHSASYCGRVFLAAGTGTQVEGTPTRVRRYTKGTWSRVLMSSGCAEGPSCLKVAQPHNTDVPEGQLCECAGVEQTELWHKPSPLPLETHENVPVPLDRVSDDLQGMFPKAIYVKTVQLREPWEDAEEAEEESIKTWKDDQKYLKFN